MDELTGSVERITFYNEENGYTVLRLLPDRKGGPAESRDGLVTVTGNLPELAPGEHLKLSGDWTHHPKHGAQFNAQTLEQTLPATTEGLRRYLASGLLRGIGPKIADRIVEHFGMQTFEILEEHPARLLEVADIGPKRSKLILAAWQEQKQIKDIMLFLYTHGVTTNLAIKIYKQYGDRSLQVVQSDPYQLARDIYGVGFRTADKIAVALGLPADHPTRIEAGLVYLLEEQVNEGHVFLPRSILIQKSTELLQVSPQLAEPGLTALVESEHIVLEEQPGNELPGGEDDRAVYLAQHYFAEVGTANRLLGLASALPGRLSDIPPLFVQNIAELSPEQNAALKTTLSHPVSILTGGPGTGKTTALKALIAAVESAGKRFALASPTGRAAKRLSEATGRKASTLHRLLDFSPTRGFVFNAENPLPLDLLVVDEASMLDTLLANSLFKALEPGTHILLVGDVDQLPSVGAGDVLRDVIDSGLFPVTRLSTIFRQAADSHIITNAHLINRGESPDFPKQSGDFFRFPANSPEEAAQWVVDLVTARIPERFGLAPADIQVLAPMYRGPAGITMLNERLQAALNPPSPIKAERRLFGTLFRPGDKVMQIRNDYDKLVFNGDIGHLRSISAEDHTLTVDFEGRPVEYGFSEADQLVLAYAISVHKAQGSEFPAVVLPLLTQHYMMLQRNLLYTAITRARKLCILVSNPKTIAIAVKTNPVANRWTGLDWRLKHSNSI
ncbi:MAG: ATP-dependent RecD-like DNA helicase [Anaerolineae bacterium]|nr:MAG: ATP-dependent RecD-like DNA helicase [Anaerolineae bacterium]